MTPPCGVHSVGGLKLAPMRFRGDDAPEQTARSGARTLPLLQCFCLSLCVILKESGRYPVDSADMIAKKFGKIRA